jgi:hypothetical protein
VKRVSSPAYKIDVKAECSDGKPLTGIPFKILNKNNKTIAIGHTNIDSVSGRFMTKCKINISDNSDYIFERWKNRDLEQYWRETELSTKEKALMAIYVNTKAKIPKGKVLVTVETRDNKDLTRIQSIIIKEPPDTKRSIAWSPARFILDRNNPYVIICNSWEHVVFAEWEDNHSRNPIREIRPIRRMAIKAKYWDIHNLPREKIYLLIRTKSNERIKDGLFVKILHAGQQVTSGFTGSPIVLDKNKEYTICLENYKDEKSSIEFTFKSWKDGSTDECRTLKATDNITLTANYEVTQLLHK